MWYETLLPRILNMTITGSIVILVLVLLRPVMKKCPRGFSYGLWAVVAFRLLCPVTWTAEFSMLGALDLPATGAASIEYIPTDIVSDPFPEVDFLVEGATDLVNANLPQGWEQVEQRPLAKWMGLGTILWALGAGTMAGVSLYALGKLKRTLAGAKHLGENVYTAPGLGTPLVLGLWKPRIYLPEGMAQEEQAYVLIHENCHIRRGDPLAKAVGFAALCVHWFNPLVWVAFRMFDRDLEMSCDEAAVKDMDQAQRCDYSQALLHLATGTGRTLAHPLCFAEGNPKGRIRHVLKWKRPTKTQTVTLAGVGLLLVLSLMTDPVVALETEDPAFTGRIRLNLPQDFDYALLRDPNFNSDRGNVVIFQTTGRQPVVEGCVSLDFTGNSAPMGARKTELFLPNRVKATFSGDLMERFGRIYCSGASFGNIEIVGHNTWRWSAQEQTVFQNILKTMEIDGTAEYRVVDLTREPYLTAGVEKLGTYGFWTDRGQMRIDLTGMRGKVTVLLVDAYTGREAGRFVTENAALDDHHTFTGLTMRKEYELTVTGSDTGTVTIFQ